MSRLNARIGFLFPLLGALSTLALDSPGQRLGEQATRVVIHQYGETEDWALRSLVLLSLGREFHPTAAQEVLMDALREKDDRLRAFAMSTIQRAADVQLPAMASPKFIELLLKQSKEKNEVYRDAALNVLGRMIPTAGATSVKEWKRWWSKNRREWSVPEWVEPDQKPAAAGDGTASAQFLERAFDLNDAGLDVVISIDSTGSMQRAIDASRDAVGDLVELLQGIAPRFRLGLTHYKDLGDMSDGAGILEPLTPKVASVRERLAKLTAGGGGDTPERVEKGIEKSVLPAMGWRADSNKVLILVGDAPPHYEALPRAIELARQAHENPRDLRVDNRPVTGPKQDVRPFVVSALAVGKAPEDAFTKISEAGGGKCASLNVNRKGGEAAKDVARHIMALSFGAQFQDEVDVFVDLYYAWRDSGFFRRSR